MKQFFEELKGKVCVITGGAGVIGTSLTRGLSTAGMKTVIVDIDGDLAVKIAREIATETGGTVLGIETDVLDRDSLESARKMIHDKLGRIHYLINGAGGNFSSGGDVHEIIGPLVAMDMVDLMRFTRMTGDVVRAMRACPQIVIAAVDGVCAGAGAILAMASDLRYGKSGTKTAFLFTRVGLAGCDMGA